MKRRFIGIYDYTVIMTYIGFIISMTGIFLASCKLIIPSILCLSGSAFCDMFDGKIARTKKDRTETEITDCYDLSLLPTDTMKEEFRRYLLHRGKNVSLRTVKADKTYYKQLCQAI